MNALPATVAMLRVPHFRSPVSTRPPVLLPSPMAASWCCPHGAVSPAAPLARGAQGARWTELVRAPLVRAPPWVGFPIADILTKSPAWECQRPLANWKCMYHNGTRNEVRAFARRKNERKSRTSRNKSNNPTLLSEEASSTTSEIATNSIEVNSNDVDSEGNDLGAPRSDVLQACTLTSCLLLAIGLVLRQASHFASLNGLPIADPTELSFNFETWHLELVAGLVILISSSRYVLLQTWSDFRDSSEAANRQILTSLEPLDYVVVACLPGISEELLFRGALMPTFGLNWISALVTGAFFGILHLGNGRRYSFAIWATFVGFAYGIATIASSSIIVPMASHSINNIIGEFLWRFTDNSKRYK